MTDGFVPLDKPLGITSHQAVARAKKILAAAKAGHTGTLDPAATGLLVIAVGKATRLAEYLQGQDKCYLARIRFGAATTTGDAQGDPTDVAADFRLTPEKLEQALARFRGKILQTPPAASAVKINGKRAYKLFRQGRQFQLPPREVEIYRFRTTKPVRTIDSFNPEVDVEVCCSKGTYIRSLARDLGAATGIPAHLAALRRTAVGNITIGQACTFEQLAVRPERFLLNMAVAVAQMPRLDLDDSAAAAFRHGRQIAAGAPPGKVAVFHLGKLIGIGTSAAGTFKPHKVL